MHTPVDPALAETDVIGIGNALVDVLAHAGDDLVERLGVPKGGMKLIDGERAEEIYDLMGPAVEISGGSAANTIVGVAALGGRAEYVGKVRADQLGDVFAHDIRATGVTYDLAQAVDGPATGCCLILVTPDAQRTMSTYLGASVHLRPEDVDPGRIARASVLYLEGYLFDPPEAQEAFRVGARHAHDAGRVVSLTLSDSFCVERHHGAFLDMVEHHVDLLFANEAEILALYRTDDIDAAVAAVRGHVEVAVLTRSEKGSLVVTAEEVLHVPAEPVPRLVDTTGAGDLYAAGFLHGFSRGADLSTCGRLGSVAAAEVISHIGARPQGDLRALTAHLLV